MAFFNIGSKAGMAGLKPLTIAVSSTLLFACASTNNTNVNTGNAPIVSTPSTPNALPMSIQVCLTKQP